MSLEEGEVGHITLLNDSQCIAVFSVGCKKKTQMPSALSQPFMYGHRSQCPNLIYCLHIQGLLCTQHVHACKTFSKQNYY